MHCVIEPDAGVFAERVHRFLQAHRFESNLIVTTLHGLPTAPRRSDPPPVCAYACDSDGAPVGVALRTPPLRVLLTPMPPEAVTALEAGLAAFDPDVPGVLGPPAAAARFADLRAARTGRRVRTGMAQRLYALGELAWPAGVPGAARPAGEPDVPLLVGWWRDFTEEAVPGSAGHDPGPVVRTRLRAGAIDLWEVDGRPVSMAGYVGPVGGLARVAPVYTPPSDRRRGYASAVTAAAAAHALRRGADAVLLYTDLANPTSNAIYQRIGFRPLADAQEYDLVPAGPAGL